MIYTKPRHEKKVHNQLTDFRITSFLPSKKVLRTWCDRRRYVEEPLFPSYVFIYLNDRQTYTRSLDMQGSLSYVRLGKEIARVSDAEVNNIRLATIQRSDITVSDGFFETGRKVVISRGALKGLSCEIVEYDHKKKLLVRVSLLQRNILISIPEHYLIPI
ncbi:transcription antitermination protein RfaH [Puia dinghuensis]|uniref:Transcription antitermination protein RfaH n=1 Tax=Puia dinghuensis TaxID=1792502 RepID=A0A8J2UGI4_9BACT|nr:transcription antitermination protein RfaH [Puia dinghuensis]